MMQLSGRVLAVFLGVVAVCVFRQVWVFARLDFHDSIDIRDGFIFKVDGMAASTLEMDCKMPPDNQDILCRKKRYSLLGHTCTRAEPAADRW